MNRRKVTRYSISSQKLTRSTVFAILSDLHNAPFDDVLPYSREADAVLVPGDLLNRHRHEISHAVALLREVSEIKPTFFSLGNHEWRSGWRNEFLLAARSAKAELLLDSYTRFGEIVIGGSAKEPPAWLMRKMAAEPAFSLLMCHKPELFEPYVKRFDIDLTVSGHAHGGQIAIFGQGLYSPGQGIFPKLTSGFYFDNRLLVSRGMTNSEHPIPRFGAPCEILLLTLTPKN
ncbi:MAG: metallophosphoesterase [Eubacteriales bacterium]|nr:metallophosphoesterase [Eubacteriales bacterium]